MNLPWYTREIDQVVCNHDNFICILGISQCKTEKTACRWSFHTIGISKGISSRCSNHCDIDLNLTILDSLVPATMRAKNSHTFHLSLGSKPAKWSVHTSFNMVNSSVFQEFYDRFMTGE